MSDHSAAIVVLNRRQRVQPATQPVGQQRHKGAPYATLVALLAASTMVAPVSAATSASVLLRSYIEDKNVRQEPRRQPWIQSAQWNLQHDWQLDDDLQLQWAGSLFSAITFHDPANIGELAHLGRGRDEHLLGYPGRYHLSIQSDDWHLRWGLQDINLPFMLAKDNLWLPPTWQGITGCWQLSPQWQLFGGRLSHSRLRGRRQLEPMLSAYGFQPFNALGYAGLHWQASPQHKVIGYLNQASDLWRQSYLSHEHRFAVATNHYWLLSGAYYHNNETGAARQGPQDGVAASWSVGYYWSHFDITASLQRNWSRYFLDYALDAYGPGLSNVMVSDYNAPGEFSQQVKLGIAGAAIGLPQLSASLWLLAGQSADESLQTVPGDERRHLEWGLLLQYRVTEGWLAGADLSLTAVDHHANGPWPDPAQTAARLVLNWPINLF